MKGSIPEIAYCIYNIILLLTIKTYTREIPETWHIIPRPMRYNAAQLISVVVVRFPICPGCKTSHQLILEGPVPAIDVCVQSSPSTGTELLCLCYILKIDHVFSTFDDCQVSVFGSAVSLSIAPCFLLLDQTVCTRERQGEGKDSC